MHQLTPLRSLRLLNQGCLTVNHVAIVLLSFVVLSFTQTYATAASGADDNTGYYTEPQIFSMRPRVGHGKALGHIGPTGIVAYVEDGKHVTVESTQPNSPAEGEFKKGQIITSVNGQTLIGRNPYVVLGSAITEAEASDGKLTFDILDGDAKSQVTVAIPVLGSYAKTWPVDCAKSQRIIKEAAEFYQNFMARRKSHDIASALACLYLLSTGDDQYLPTVKQYFSNFTENPARVGDHTWNNGYNGIACAEYYLRTGDKDVLPLLQYYCDNAKERQRFGIAWGHWGRDINPRYVAGGLMNAASVQVLTTLLLAKQCGVEVDEETLQGALKFFYRFTGKGTNCYGDHRGEGGLGSNGKDGMVAAAMQAASYAKSNTAIYENARDYLTHSTITSYPTLVTGHGDNGRGDGIWRGLNAALLRDKKPEAYQDMMNRLQWWYDLSRYHDGGLGMAGLPGFNDPGSGAATVLAYTAPLKTLQITGAPRSKYAKDFTLPTQLWGREADLVFVDIEPLREYAEYGEPDPIYIPFYMLGTAYQKVQSDIPREQMLKNIYHSRYMIRSQAAKALLNAEAYSEIERMLTADDPRLRRAALDAINDWRYWHALGRSPLKTEQFTPAMVDAIVSMLRDPDESLFVTDGALYAVQRVPLDTLKANVEVILPWTTHEEWWLREAAFYALSGLDRDEASYIEILPTLIQVWIDEYHTMPRQRMTRLLQDSLRKHGPDSRIGKMIAEGFKRSIRESEVLTAEGRAPEGMYNVLQAAKHALQRMPDAALPVATALSKHFEQMRTSDLVGLVKDDLLTVLPKMDAKQRDTYAKFLYETYRPELVTRLKAERGLNAGLIDVTLQVTELGEAVAGWQVVGKPKLDQRAWQYISVDPLRAEDGMLKRERKRFRHFELPEALQGWFKPGYDASSWQTGHAPIGVGEFKERGKFFENRSNWGKGEFLLARTEIEIDSLDYDLYRLRILSPQGFDVYINGKQVSRYVWWKSPPEYAIRMLTPAQVKLLKEGTNLLGVYTGAEYPSAMKAHWKVDKRAQMDCYIEGLRQSDLY